MRYVKIIVNFKENFDFDICLASFNRDTAVTSSLFSNMTIDVTKSLTFIHAIIISIEENNQSDFIEKANYLDYIDQCSRDLAMDFAKFDSANESQLGSELKLVNFDNLRDLHRLDVRKTELGAGTKIAIIDSGMNSHPTLPSRSLAVALRSQRHHRDIYKVFSNFDLEYIFDSVIRYEEKHIDVFQDPQLFQIYKDKYLKSLLFLFETSFESWKSGELTNYCTEMSWCSSQSLPTDNIKKPDPFWVRNILGSIRSISLDSWNLVDDTPDITDVHGHGTNMLGILSSTTGFSSCYDSYVKYGIGISPYSEVVILKVYDKNIKEETSISCVEALERVNDAGDIDAVYIGLTLNRNTDPADVLALDKAITKVSSAGVAIICPAGNDSSPKLSFPAVSADSIGVTGIELDCANNLFSYSQSNNSTHSIGSSNYNTVPNCTAFSGSDNLKLLSTSNNGFGFEPVNGTSVSAAIVLGKYAAELSIHYQTNEQAYYNEISEDYYHFTDNQRSGFKFNSKKAMAIFSKENIAKSNIMADMLANCDPKAIKVAQNNGQKNSVLGLSDIEYRYRFGNGVF